jgi:hypothetical protein
MMKLLIPLLCIWWANFSVAQQTYAIQNLGTTYSTNQINEAFTSADFCGMYYTSVRRELLFDDGTIVELYSSTELPNLPATCFVSPSTANDTNIWRITADGYLLRTIQTPTVKQ